MANERETPAGGTPGPPTVTEADETTSVATVASVTNDPLINTVTSSTHDVPKTIEATVARTSLRIAATRLVHRFPELVMRPVARRTTRRCRVPSVVVNRVGSCGRAMSSCLCSCRSAAMW